MDGRTAPAGDLGRSANEEADGHLGVCHFGVADDPNIRWSTREVLIVGRRLETDHTRFIGNDPRVAEIEAVAIQLAAERQVEATDFLIAALQTKPIAERLAQAGIAPDLLVEAALARQGARPVGFGLGPEAKALIEAMGEAALSEQRPARAVDLLVALSVSAGAAGEVLRKAGLFETRIRDLFEEAR
ncbi:MAG: hypothetical protein HY263_08835 [Chloroflexi bacterium]|nr:hypothetical protein [Chloroflexota bacterium]